MSLLIQILRQSRSIARIEAGFFVRRAKLLWSIAVVALIPCLYSLIYLSSIWDPAAHSNELKVGLVNLDQGLVYREQPVNVGQELSDMLKAQARFDYQLMDDEAAARAKVKQGQLAFALIIPKNFSANAVPGEQVGAGQLVVFASQGNHLESARIAQQFATELGHKINESLNTKRWSLVLVNAAGSKQSVSRLRQGLQELHQGAEELNQGASQASSAAKAVHLGAQHLSEHLTQLTDQSKKMGSGLRQLDSTRPRNSDLRKLDEGADSLASGMTELGQGLQKIKTGNEQLMSAVSAFKEEASNQLLVSSAMVDNVGQVYASLQKIDNGLQASLDNGKKLEDGARNMKTGVTGLTQGVRQINTATRTMSTQFPEDAQLESLDKGATELASGTLKLSQGNESISQASRRLEAGLALVGNAIPATDNVLEGSPEGLADSVRPRMEIDATVGKNGMGFIANVLPAALWLGAGIAVFFVNLRSQPIHAKAFHPVALWLGKLALPGALVVLQGLLLLFTVFTVLQIEVVNPLAFICTLLSAGLAFFFVISALTHFMGDAGKALAMVFLAIQLTSSGGLMPVELSGSFFATVSPWLPITWLTHGIKATVFGAFEGTWLLAWLQVTGIGLLAALITVLFGRWRFVSVRQLRPQMDL
ncbi:MAG: DUF3533 domain-containing protein [Curvibacter sp.]|nr:MAG: DUF3533 domain-containing protein [Curvibacter sp.]